MKVVFWWNIPCKGMINVLKCYAEDIDNTAIVVTGELSRSRKAMGWKDGGKLFENHIVLSDSEWDVEGRKLIDRYNSRLHVFNGITYSPRMKRLIEYAISQNVAFCNMSEAYFNLERGWKRIVKDIFMSTLLPLETKGIAKRSRGIICLSGDSKRDVNQFKRLGFSSFYPFGYFTNEQNDKSPCNINEGQVQILCPGLLEYYKGVDILISALSILKKKGVNNYICHITGNGHEKQYLQNLTNSLKVNDVIVFEGVLDSDSYNKLLAKIDILIAPGRVEPWGIRINEAIQRGDAVVVSDGIGANCLIKESGGGAVFKSGSSFDLAKKLEPYLRSQDNLIAAKKNNVDYKKTISCMSQAKRLSEYLNEMSYER